MYLRKRYLSLLPNNGAYHPNNLICTSSDVDRTIQSAAYALSGMFPAENVQSENDSPLRQLVPIHTIPSNMDHMLRFTQSCALYDMSYDEPMSTEQKQMLETTAEYLELNAGLKFRSCKETRKIYDTLLVEQQQNFT